MPSDPPENNPALGDEKTKWLLQFYHTSKPSDLADSAPSEPLPELVTVPPGKYRVSDEVGSGGMKSVLRTRDRSTERNVAMAVLRDAPLRSKKITRFVREARITAALEHPNIVPVYDIGADEEGKPYFTMKLLGGETLESILQRVYAGYSDYRTRYSLNSLLRIFQGVCDAISFAHSRGVIHLDLKPANIQVGDFGEVLVLDWGLAKVFENDPNLHPDAIVLDPGLRAAPSEGTISGTPGFMSPEQSRGENATLDERTDIYALGAILYAILNCRKSEGETDGRSHQENPKIPAALEAVARKAMSGLPAQRYRTVEDLARDVRAYTEGYATKAQQAGAFTLLWLLFKRHNVVASLTLVSLVTVFSILATSYIKIRHSELREHEAFEKYKAEQAGKYRVGLLAAPNVMEQAREALRRLDYDQAISLLEHAVSLDKDYSDAWLHLAALRLGRQEFDQAAVAFSHLPKPDAPLPYTTSPPDLQGVVEKYSRLFHEKGAGGLRNAQDDFVTDIINAGHTAWPFRQMALVAFFKDHNRNPRTVDFGTIEKALRLLNSNAKDMVFTHEDTPLGLKIVLHSDSISEVCPLAGLPVSVLDASGTGPMDLEWLQDAPLISVDLSGSRTWDLHPLNQSSTLQELRIVGWRNKDYSRIPDLPNLKRLIVDAPDVAEVQSVLEKDPAPPKIIGE